MADEISRSFGDRNKLTIDDHVAMRIWLEQQTSCACINNHIYIKLRDVITHQYPDVNNELDRWEIKCMVGQLHHTGNNWCINHACRWPLVNTITVAFNTIMYPWIN